MSLSSSQAHLCALVCQISGLHWVYMIPGIKERSNHEKHLVIDFSKDILSEKFFQKAQFMEIIEPD